MATLRSVTALLGELYEMYRDLPDYQDFFTQYDIGVPLAWMTANGFATPSENGIQMIDEAWVAFCDIVGVDKYNDFDNVNDLENFLATV